MSDFLGSIPSIEPSNTQSSLPAVSPKSVKDTDLSVISNADFVSAIFQQLPDGASAAVCSKAGDPSFGGWVAMRAEAEVETLSTENNNYICCSSFSTAADQSFNVRKENFSACHFLMLDDLGTKVSLDQLGDFELSWLIETSPGNFQGGILLAEPISDGDQVSNLLKAIIDAGFCDPGASGPLSRWARLPLAINGKPKYADEAGASFRCRLAEWRPEKRYTPQEIVDGLKLAAQTGLSLANRSILAEQADGVFIPKAEENPVLSALKERGLYKTPLGSGKHDVTCPWLNEHTDQLDTGAAYFEPDDAYPSGGFCCQHSHRDQYHIPQLLEFLNVRNTEARHKPVIRVVAGDLHRVVDVAEKVLAKRGRHYQSGGLIVSISTDPVTGNPSVVPTSIQSLTREMSVAAIWEKYDGRSKDWVQCDPPTRHMGILFETQDFRHLPVLAGVVRQPYFRESDGELVTKAGYDQTSQRFGVFDAKQFQIPEPTKQAAVEALAILEDLLREFHFVSPTDKVAALSAMFTAVVRPSFAHAPAYHAHAPAPGSGKSYLCELIAQFAAPGGNAKVSYPTTSEEATKVMLSLLLTSPAVIEFDDMDTDWIPHGTIKRMLTADKITDRILGVSKTATVSTRALFLGSGNNVGPVRDLLRRVLTIHLNARTETPATLTYKYRPVEQVSKERGRYVAAVLTIIQAWRKAGCPKANVENIVTFDGAWSDYCRYPLVWLDHPDPATSLLEQVKHDPDSDALAGLMTEWRRAFGSRPTTVRKAVERAVNQYPDLLDAMREYPIEERGSINPSKLGWIIKKSCNRIVAGYEFQKAEADGRTAWRVVPVNTPPLPSLTPFEATAEETVFTALPRQPAAPHQTDGEY